MQPMCRQRNDIVNSLWSPSIFWLATQYNPVVFRYWWWWTDRELQWNLSVCELKDQVKGFCQRHKERKSEVSKYLTLFR